MIKILFLDFEILRMILGIISLPFILWGLSILMLYMLGAISKLTNRRIVRRGRTIADPQTIDYINKDLKEKKDRVLGILKDIKAKLNSNNKILDNTASKIDRLKDLDNLLKNNVITQSEFEVLKKEILKS
jgi:hypothetical protein